MQKQVHKLLLAVCLTLTAVTCGCLSDDIPYPHIQANFLEISAEGQTRPATIDSINRTVTFYLPEQTDIYAVPITGVKLTPDATVVDDVLSQPVDLSEPYKLNLHLYYDYTWTLTAVQDIERYFTVTGQIGSSTIDVPAHRVVATVSDKTDIANLHVESIKLGADGSDMNPSLEGHNVDFTHPVEVIVTTHGHRTIWTIYIDQTTSVVSTIRVDAWTNVAWVYCQTEAGRPMGVQYRLKGDTEWTDVPESWIYADGGDYYARLVHLSPFTAYEARAVSDDQYGEIIDFTTGTAVQPPNMDFESWWLDGKIWCPWAQDGTPYWGTGNKGATTLGPSNTTPSEDTPTGSGLSAQLLTKFVGIGILGKLAAGNIFVGSYVATDGTNGILSFGREFTQRPTGLKGYLKYQTAPISSTTQGFENLAGRPDTCIIWCALIDQNEPFEIRTRPTNRQLFDKNGPYVVAYGSAEYGQNTSGWIPFEFKLDYTSTQRVPKYLLITASASKYGDYFTGGDGATLWLDNLELLYDY